MNTFIIYCLIAISVLIGLRLLQKLRYWNSVCENITLLGPRHLVYGHMHLFNDMESYLKHLRTMVLKTREKIFADWMFFFFPHFSVCHPDTAKILLKTSEPKPKLCGQPYRHFAPWLGEGLLLSDGKKWERNRKLLTPAFHFSVLKSYMKIYNEVVDTFLDQIEKKSKQEEYVDICSPVGMATLDTMLRCAFSYQDDIQLKGESHQYVKAVNVLPKIAVRRSLSPWLYPDLIFNCCTLGRQFKQNVDYVHKFSSGIIERRRKSMEMDTNKVHNGRIDFLGILLTAKDKFGKGMSDEEIQAEVDTFLYEGHDTTASAICWTIYCLARYPEEQAKVFQEVQRVVARDFVEWAELQRFHYLSMFIREVMRIYTPVPFISRRLTSPYVYEDIEIPTSATIDINLMVLHNHPDVYPDYETFRPERFRETKTMDPYAFVPFSAGPRNCIGQHFALHEMKVFIARLVKRYRVILDTHNKIEFVPESTLKSKYGIKVKLLQRNIEQ